MAIAPKPLHLETPYSQQFCDASVVRAYPSRPPYPRALFPLLASLAAPGPSRMLELGCGSGDLTIGLAPFADQIDAIDPSAPMLALAWERQLGLSNVRWHLETAEAFEPRGSYSLAVAAESLHWMQWDVVLPKIARVLDPRGALALVTSRTFIDLPWEHALRTLIAQYSTNRDYRAYDLVRELTRRGLFEEGGRRETEERFSQDVDAYIESFHSRNGFSRDRMAARAAGEFDAAVRELVLAHCPTGIIDGTVVATIVWGTPLAC